MSHEYAVCPFLVTAVADRLWRDPPGVYCRPLGRVHVPARSTLMRLCTTPAHALCAGYVNGREARFRGEEA
jgi:hypothetical protein